MKKIFNISHSQRQLLDETALILERSSDSLIKEFYILEKNNLNIENKKANTKKLIKWIFSLRYPEYSRAKNNFDTIKERLSKDNIEFIFDNTFEQDDYSIKINFSCAGELDKSLSRIRQLLKDVEKSMEYIRP